MTRAEKIKIRAERVRGRIERAEQEKMKREALLANTVSTTITDVPEGKITIEICIHCYNYQKRLTWMLSSLLDQQGDTPNIIVNISHADNDGNPTTDEVCKFFREKGLNIIETKMTKEEVSNRAIARNKQATATTADWILFADSDLVYDPLFFDDLQKRLKTDLSNIHLVMGADRHSLQDQFCIKYFEDDKRIYPCKIEDSAKLASEFPVKWKMGKDTCAGYFQLVNVKVLKEKGGGLITGKAKDHWRNTRGDRALRVRLGGRYGISNTKPMYHLNHDRGGPEMQR